MCGVCGVCGVCEVCGVGEVLDAVGHTLRGLNERGLLLGRERGRHLAERE